MIQLVIGLNTEGPTDVRFLTDIVKRTFDDIAFECPKDIEILDIQHIAVQKDEFAPMILEASRKGVEDFGISILCVHRDADDKNMDDVMKYSFLPLSKALEDKDEAIYCKVIIPVIPVRMMEAWMLADTQLLKDFIDASKVPDGELGIERNPESYADPKAVIEEAIRKASAGKTKRRRDVIGIAELYEQIGKNVNLENLRHLPSFRCFEEQIRSAFRRLNYLH